MEGRPENIGKFVYWTPRILSILFICFLALFSLDVFGTGLGFWGTVLGLFMHNIPVFILAVVLWISWSREIVGGVVFTLAGSLYIGLIAKSAIINSFEWYMLVNSAVIAAPAFLIGGLFFVNWSKRKKVKSAQEI